MALRQRTDPRSGTPQLHVVAQPVRPRTALPSQALEDEFLFAPKTAAAGPSAGARAPSVRPRALLRALVVVCLLVAGFLVVRNLTATKPQPPVPVTNAPAAAPVTATQPAGIAMSVVKSTLSPASASDTYRAVVTLLNSNDVAADDVTVKVTLRDASGNVVTTQTQSVPTLASGKTVDVVISGELDPAAAPPTGLEVSATAARLESPA